MVEPRSLAFVMGWRHGVSCVGCCWALMALFVAGVMNPFWIVLLTLFVILEKVAPYGDVIARVAGLGLVIAGTWLAVASDQLMFSM
jgi:predicted metal-binding membrane protein